MKSIRRHLSVWLLISVSLVLAVGGGVAYWAARMALLREFDAKLLAQAQTLMAQTEQNHEDIEFKFPPEYLRGAAASAGETFFELQLGDGSILARSSDWSAVDFPRRWGTLERPAHWEVNVPGLPPLRMLGLKFIPGMPAKPRKPPPPPPPEKGEKSAEKPLAPLPAGPPPAPQEVKLIVASDRSPLEAALGNLQLILLAAGLSALLTGVLAIGYVLQRGLAPLTQLAEQAAAIHAANLRQRFQVRDIPAELAPITARLNSLLDRLEASFERERRFSADLAHEFRTPLAELRTLAELESARATGAQAEAFKEVLDIAGQMEKLAGGMLALARAEQGQMQPAVRGVRVVRLIEECAARQASAMQARRLQWRMSLPPDAAAWSVNTDEAFLRSILNNLMENAALYAPEGSVLELELSASNGSLNLALANLAPDLKDEDLPHLTERFWRQDAARTTAGHFGLGLPLAHALAQALGGSLRLHRDRAGRLVVHLENLPLDTIASR